MATNLGTAYVSVMPSMQGFGKAVESGMSGIDTSGAGSKMGQRAASGFAGGMAKGGVIMGAASALTTKAFDAVASSADRAIARVDTMQNYPKVMANLGYSTDDAAASIQRMSDRLDGLPTALDSMVSMTQQLAPLTGDLSSATEIALAFNDMMLAGGASTMDQARALTQYTQALAKGKPEMNDWRSLQQTMPGQLNQVAQAMLGAGKNSNDLYQALKDGTVTMDDFNKAVLRLDSEGVNGFASFQKQAQDATVGIQTAMDNLTTRTAKGVATLIDAIGQENISGAINTLSSGIGSVANDLAVDLKSATEFIKGFEGEIKSVVGFAYDIAPMAIRAWGAFKLFEGGKAVLGGLSAAGEAVVTKLGSIGMSAQGLAFEMKNAGVIGSQAMYNLGGIMSDVGMIFGSMTVGATGLVAGLGVSIAALYAWNQSIWEAAYAAGGLTAEQQAVVDSVNGMAASYDKIMETRNASIAGVDREFDSVRTLIDEYNGLVDANGNITEGYEDRASAILDAVAESLGIERSEVESLIDAYGRLGDAAEESMKRRQGEKVLEADDPAYNQALSTLADAEVNYGNAVQASAEQTAKSTKVNADYAQSQQDILDTMSATPEAISYAAMATGNFAYEAQGAADGALEAAEAVDVARENINNLSNVIANHEGLAAAIDSGDVERIEEYTSRVTNSVITAENGTRESLQKQVETFRSSYNGIEQAIANGEQGLEDNLASMGTALAAAESELARYDAIQIADKAAEVNIEEGSLIIANDHVYEWNGTQLIDKGSTADVDDASLEAAQEKLYTWNGSELESKEGTATVSIDTSAWDSWVPGVKEGVVNIVRNVTDVFSGLFGGDAAGGFYKLHASGGFITNGPTVLGRDASGTVHIAGEAGREWVKKHADGTTSILPIENKKYLAPYAETIAKMIGGTGEVHNHYTINGLEYLPGSAIAAAMEVIFGEALQQARMG